MGQLDGFHFDPDRMQAAINHLKAMRDDIEQHDIPRVQRLLSVQAPGTAPETLRFQAVMQRSHAEHLQMIRNLEQKVRNDIANLEAAMAQYDATEETNTDGLRQKD